MPYIGQGLEQGRRQLYTFTATASQTTFSASYTPGYVDVFQNGILLAPGDYTATNGTSIVLGVGAAVNDEITIIAQHLFSVADVVSASQGGTFAGDVTMAGNLTVQGTTITVDTSTAQTLAMGDADKIILGDDNDLQIFHNNGNNRIQAENGPLFLQSNDTSDGVSVTGKNASETMAKFLRDGAVELYHNNDKKLETLADGVSVTGSLGVGTSTPNTEFDVVGEISVTNANGQRNGLYTNTDGQLVFFRNNFSNGATTMVIDDETGNVGIGGTPGSSSLFIYDSDYQQLEISGLRPTIWMTEDDGNANENFQLRVNGGKFLIQQQNDAQSNAQTRVTVLQDGKVGIGTESPLRNISVIGSDTSSSGYKDIAEFLEPSITGGTVSVNFGVANSLNNLGKVDFTYVGAGSTSNRVNLGFHSNDNKLMVYANGTVELGDGQTLNSTGATIQTVTATPNTMASGNPVNVWSEIHSNYRVQMTSKKGGRILGTYHIPMNPTGASNILMAIAPWYSTNGGTTKNIIAQGISSGSRHNLAVSWFRSSNGFDANDMQNHVVHFHLDGITASTTVVFGWYFRSEGGNTTYFCHSNGNNNLWGWTAPMYMELREIMT